MLSSVGNIVAKSFDKGIDCAKKTVYISGLAIATVIISDSANYYFNLNSWNNFPPCENLKITTINRIYADLRLERDPNALSSLCETLKRHYPESCGSEGCDNPFIYQQYILLAMAAAAVSVLFASILLTSITKRKEEVS